MTDSDDIDRTFQGTGPDNAFARFLVDGRFMLQRSKASGLYYFPPRTLEPCSGVADLEWQEASGLGTVYSATVVSQRPEKGGPYNVAIIELTEGPRMMSRVVDVAPDEVVIGMSVTARIVDIDGTPALEFVPAHAEAT